MFSSRRFLGVFLIVTVLSAGFSLLPDPLVQKSDACGQGCEEAIQKCKKQTQWAIVACLYIPEDACKRRKERAAATCRHRDKVCDPNYSGSAPN